MQFPPRLYSKRDAAPGKEPVAKLHRMKTRHEVRVERKAPLPVPELE
jgi:hypothetical protein